MDFRKIKRLNAEFEAERERLSAMLTAKFGREILISPNTEGLCVLFGDQDMTGITLDDFERLAAQPGFDIWEIETVL